MKRLRFLKPKRYFSKKHFLHFIVNRVGGASKSFGLYSKQLDPFQPSVTFYIETSHLLCAAKQITGSQLVRRVIPLPAPPSPATFSKIPTFLEIQDVPTFHRPNRKTKVLNDSFNRLVYKFYPQSIFILEECLLKW